MRVLIDYEMLPWAAGFYEGEGNITAYARKNTRVLQLSVSQVDREPLEQFSRVLGGLLIFGPYQHGGRKSEIYTLKVTGQRAADVLDLLWPWLSERRKEQGRTALATWNEVERRQPRDIEKRRKSQRDWARRRRERVASD